jgi:hypothetical protein
VELNRRRELIMANNEMSGSSCIQCGAKASALIEAEVPEDSVLAKERARAEGRQPHAEIVTWCGSCWIGGTDKQEGNA